MVFEYDRGSDMLYIKLSNEVSAESEEVAPGVVIDLSQANQIVGIEIENASKFIDLSRLELSSLPITTLVLTERTPATA
jgi:uncharacterized protein YuzE